MARSAKSKRFDNDNLDTACSRREWARSTKICRLFARALPHCRGSVTRSVELASDSFGHNLLAPGWPIHFDAID